MKALFTKGFLNSSFGKLCNEKNMLNGKDTIALALGSQTFSKEVRDIIPKLERLILKQEDKTKKLFDAYREDIIRIENLTKLEYPLATTFITTMRTKLGREQEEIELLLMSIKRLNIKLFPDELLNFVSDLECRATDIIQTTELMYSSITSAAKKKKNSLNLPCVDSNLISLKMERSNLKPREGYIYVMSCSAMLEGQYKIGFTGRHPTIRATELTRRSTNGRDVYEVCFEAFSKEPYIVEQRVHDKLSPYHVTNEFYQPPLELAISIIKSEIHSMNLMLK